MPTSTPARPTKLTAFLNLVRFQHTLFALPFAYVGMLLAAQGWPGAATFAWVTLAMVGARSFAMALNRILDRRIDAANPRTASRELPRGVLSLREAWLLALASLVVFVVAGLALNPLTAALLPLAALFMGLYPLIKRFSWWCHAWLGVTIGAAAPGGYIAVTGSFDATAWWLWLAVGAWIAGFDVIYAMLDEAFDRSFGVFSIPARFGPRVAVGVARGAYAIALIALLAVAQSAALGPGYLLAVALVALLFALQHGWLARRGAAVALQAFDANLVIGALVLAGVVLDLVLRGVP